MRQLFFYGTLRDPAVLTAVLGRPSDQISIRSATLPDYEICAVKGREFPFARAAKGGVAEGVLVSGLSEEDVARLEFYEGAYLFDLVEVTVETDGKPAKAELFVTAHHGWQADGPWSLERWIAWDQGVSALAALEVMDYFGKRAAHEVFPFYPTLRMRAESRLAAQEAERPKGGLHANLPQPDVDTLDHRRPYLGFFALEERRLKFRKFDGSMSGEVDRAVFLSADAVTVLPYDPGSDHVLLIEQFRVGPLGRGDPYPWCLEPIAGRVDSGESYEQAAMREAQEESGLTLDRLEKIGDYYSSPGALSEFLVSYVGIVTLDPKQAGIHGLDSEAEDIRTLIIPFERLMQAVDEGGIDTGPLLLSALWLARNRARLREGHE
jgi:ADP-ribose diphosphatase